MARFKDWPAETYEAYQEILKRQKLLEAMVTTCQEGNREKNEELLRRLVRLVYNRSRQVEEYCQEIVSHLPDSSKGRNPKWYTVTLDIQANAMTIGEIVSDIGPALKRIEFEFIDTLLLCMQKKVREIGRLLEEHPHTGLSVWEKVIDEALNDFD